MAPSVRACAALVALLLVVALAFAVLFAVYYEKYSNAEDDISTLEDEISTLEDDISTLEDDISTLEDEISTLEDEISTLEDSIPLPNVLLITADDLGWNDIGYNNPAVKTPNMDELAKEGRILTQHYTGSVCTPSRAALLSGRYPHKTQMHHFLLSRGNPHCLPTDIKLLPEWLKSVGYRTHLVGKWHLGYCQEACLPNQRGFDTFYGQYSGSGNHYTHSVGRPGGLYDFRDNGAVDKSVIGNHTTDVLVDRAVQIIRESNSSDEPMFMFLSLTAPHTPLQAPQEYLDMYPDLEGNKQTIYAMVTQMDDGIGHVVRALRDACMKENTLIVFLSDNGGDPSAFHSNHPLRGGKASVWEGGTRTLSFINGPMVNTSAGTGTTDGMFHQIDWTPTILSLVGVDVQDPAIDGVDQSGMLMSGEPSIREEFVYHLDMEDPLSFGQAAIRQGKYKLIWGYEGFRDGWEDSSSGAGQTWDMPWNMELLGLDPVKDSIAPPPGVIPSLFGTNETIRRERELISLKRFYANNITSGSVHLYDIEADPTEQNDLSEVPAYNDKVMEMKRKILDILETEYVVPQPLAQADWSNRSESMETVGPERAISPGWCDDLDLTLG